MAAETDLSPAMVHSLSAPHSVDAGETAVTADGKGELVIGLPARPSLLAHCRRLVEAGWPLDTIVRVYRAGTLCFEPTSLGHFASLTTEERSDGTIRFVPYREPFATRKDEG